MTPLDELLPEPDLDELLTHIRSLLVYAAQGGAVAREHAVEYLNLRQRLLDSPIGKLLPGFLYQCVTIVRFKDFISLYDPETALRVAFIDRMIDRCLALRPGAAPQPRDEPMSIF